MSRVDDLRSREDGLGWVTRAVFGDQRITLAVDAPVPAGHTVVARYAVVPSVDRARFLLPLGSSRATAAALLAYNALRPVKVRAVRAALGVAARAGVVARAPFPVLSVAVPTALDPAEVLLAERLSTELGGGRAYAACGVRPPDPNHKPTLQLFDHAGTPCGYAKIGWNDATRALVTAEAAALREVAEVAGVAGHPATPDCSPRPAGPGRPWRLSNRCPSGYAECRSTPRRSSRRCSRWPGGVGHRRPRVRWPARRSSTG